MYDFYEKFKSKTLTVSDCMSCPFYVHSEKGHCTYYVRPIKLDPTTQKPSWCKVRHVVVILDKL